MILNMHSTLVMGRMGRYERNIMTWVRPANNKLIDRTIRYVDLFLRESNIYKSYQEIACKCFELMDRVPKDRSLVIAAVEAFRNYF
jgi:N-acetylmuramic acid 6-phosphate etherase